MPRNQSLITIGIPTYNRVTQLERAIESALNQDYNNIEVIVSDNASTDETESFCRQICAGENRLKYMRQTENIGPTANFTAVLRAASGKYFMWLGDDDWLDIDYVSSCARELSSDPDLSLVSGVPEYYQDGKRTHAGKFFSLLHNSAWRRVIGYYTKVADNGMFYGLMRTAQIRQLEISGVMGGDWLMIASVAFTGKVKTMTEICVHRELGGATASYRKIGEILGLSELASRFPKLSIAVNVWKDIVVSNTFYSSRNRLERAAAGALIFIILIVKSMLHYSRTALRWLVNSTGKRMNRQFLMTRKHTVHTTDHIARSSENKQNRLSENSDREP
jgi:glycosyltransferase involved in cell wall biosynthesis